MASKEIHVNHLAPRWQIHLCTVGDHLELAYCVILWEMTVMETVNKGHGEEQTTVAWKHTAQISPEMAGLLYIN